MLRNPYIRVEAVSRFWVFFVCIKTCLFVLYTQWTSSQLMKNIHFNMGSWTTYLERWTRLHVQRCHIFQDDRLPCSALLLGLAFNTWQQISWIPIPLWQWDGLVVLPRQWSNVYCGWRTRGNKKSSGVKFHTKSTDRNEFWILKLGGGFKYFLFSSLYGEKIPNLTNIFQRGWFNHQLVKIAMMMMMNKSQLRFWSSDFLGRHPSPPTDFGVESLVLKLTWQFGYMSLFQFVNIYIYFYTYMYDWM